MGSSAAGSKKLAKCLRKELKIINFLILIGKWYLNNSKTNNKNIYFIDFITLIKAKIEILKYIHAS